MSSRWLNRPRALLSTRRARLIQSLANEAEGSPTLQKDSCRSGFDGQPGLLPGFPAAHEGTCVFVTCLSKFLRHPGAGRFVGSSTKGYQPSLRIEAKSPRLSNRIIRQQAHGAFRLCVTVFQTAFSPHVENSDRLARLPKSL